MTQILFEVSTFFGFYLNGSQNISQGRRQVRFGSKGVNFYHVSKKMFDKGTNKVVSYDPVVRLETSKTGVGVTSISDKELLPPPVRIKDDITSDTFKDFKL